MKLKESERIISLLGVLRLNGVQTGALLLEIGEGHGKTTMQIDLSMDDDDIIRAAKTLMRQAETRAGWAQQEEQYRAAAQQHWQSPYHGQIGQVGMRAPSIYSDVSGGIGMGPQNGDSAWLPRPIRLRTHGKTQACRAHQCARKQGRNRQQGTLPRYQSGIGMLTKY